jgi:hypothetical protein
MSFSNVETAIQLFWDWGWSWKSVFIDSCNVGFDLIALDGVTRGIGSLMLTDSIFADTPKAILVFPPNSAVASGTTGITLDNVAFNNVGAAVVDTSGTVWLSASTTSVDTWTLGNTYFGSSSAGKFFIVCSAYQLAFGDSSIYNISCSNSLLRLYILMVMISDPAEYASKAGPLKKLDRLR